MVDDTSRRDAPPREVPRAADSTESEDLNSVADRLEAALDRIARNLDTPRPAATAELAARLDGLIGRLRDVLGHPQA